MSVWIWGISTVSRSNSLPMRRQTTFVDSSAQPKFWGIQLVVRNQLDWLLFWVIACIITFFSYQSFPLQKQESTLQLSEYLKGVSSCTEHDIICRHTRTHAISAASITLGLTLTQNTYKYALWVTSTPPPSPLPPPCLTVKRFMHFKFVSLASSSK